MDKNFCLLMELIEESVDESLILLKSKIGDALSIAELSTLYNQNTCGEKDVNIEDEFATLAEFIDIILNNNKTLLLKAIQSIIIESPKDQD